MPGPGQLGTSWHCRMPATQVLGTGKGVSVAGPGPTSLKPPWPRSTDHPQSAYQLSQGPATTSPGARLSQELSVDPTDRLWFSGIPEGHRSKGGGSRRHSSLHLTPHPTLLTSSTPPHSTHVLEGGAGSSL